MTEGRTDLVRRVRRALSPFPWRVVRRERLRHLTHDRYLLENVIFPALHSRVDVRSILFVGCDTYTAHYPSMFADRAFITIDIDPAKAKYGAPRHIVDSAANVEAHFSPGTLDAVICNGVIGWGLDRPDEIDQAARQWFVSLRPGGILLVGWNDLPPWRPPALAEITGLRAFTPITLSPFPASVYPTLGAMRHVFNFYARPDRGLDPG